MPIYEYECPRCGRFEASQKITEKPLARHDCGAKPTRLISATSFSLKGSGWYATDYAKNGGNKSDKKSEPSSSAA